MIVNFRACKINHGMRKLSRTPILIKKNRYTIEYYYHNTYMMMIVLKTFLLVHNSSLRSQVH